MAKLWHALFVLFIFGLMFVKPSFQDECAEGVRFLLKQVCKFKPFDLEAAIAACCTPKKCGLHQLLQFCN
ncbi:hypothetical protein CpipJ_CPIJ015608 [Culex quinquefasciatus]|uniref:Uncharacterized protein n=1 Tax=Culex quinquefasciatus TaxID=7176 RepID=B0X9X8_CULQU|nr:hypothetical protein CpipJ_CPIJ015608 [Culex quinquefasciatus]|eukprot:XP_001866450.1 hypothetical protein CpipJ_CPIJ015608 [Culex quinquefasciatus]